MSKKQGKNKRLTKKNTKKQSSASAVNKYYFGGLKKVKIPTLSVYASPANI